MKLYTMTDDEYQTLLDASKPTPAMFLSGGETITATPQENANRAWQALAEKHGFIWDTVGPVGNDPKSFYALPKVK